MSDVDTDTLLREAIDHPDVQAAVADATTLDILVAESAFSGPVTLSRPADPADYVVAITENIATFDGLTVADVTDASVAPLIPSDEDQ